MAASTQIESPEVRQALTRLADTAHADPLTFFLRVYASKPWDAVRSSEGVGVVANLENTKAKLSVSVIATAFDAVLAFHRAPAEEVARAERPLAYRVLETYSAPANFAHPAFEYKRVSSTDLDALTRELISGYWSASLASYRAMTLT